MMEFYERASGARMHAAYVRPGGVHQEITSSNWRFGHRITFKFSFSSVKMLFYRIKQYILA